MTLIDAPASEPLSLDDVKAHLRITYGDEDTLLQSYLVGARQALEQVTGLALMEQTWEAAWDGFPCGADATLVIPRPPLRSVTSVTYIDTNGDEQELDASAYLVNTRAFPGELVPAYGTAWPATRAVPNAVVVRFVAGYGDEEVDIPEGIRAALRLEVGSYYVNREELPGQDVSPTALGMVRRIMGNYQPYTV